jgi:hypothetical protein
MKTLFLILVGVLGAVACSSSSGSKPASATCSANGECSSGECLDLAVVSDGGCSSAGKACSKTCVTDPDCASLGPKFKCFAGCGGTSSCGATP